MALSGLMCSYVVLYIPQTSHAALMCILHVITPLYVNHHTFFSLLTTHVFLTSHLTQYSSHHSNFPCHCSLFTFPSRHTFFSLLTTHVLLTSHQICFSHFSPHQLSFSLLTTRFPITPNMYKRASGHHFGRLVSLT